MPVYEIDCFQIKTALRLLNSALQYLNFGSTRLQGTLDKLTQSTMTAASFLPDSEVNYEATSCLERIFRLTNK